MNTLEEVRQMVGEIPERFLPASELRPEHRLREDVGLDSLALVDLLVAMEERFGIFVDPLAVDLVEVFATVSSLCAFLERSAFG
jgi:acyl carrier protein